MALIKINQIMQMIFLKRMRLSKIWRFQVIAISRRRKMRWVMMIFLTTRHTMVETSKGCLLVVAWTSPSWVLGSRWYDSRICKRKSRDYKFKSDHSKCTTKKFLQSTSTKRNWIKLCCFSKPLEKHRKIKNPHLLQIFK